VVVIRPAPGADPYARLLALLKQAPGGQLVTRDDVVQFIKITQGVPLNRPLLQYRSLVTQAQVAALKAIGLPLYVPGQLAWALANQSQLFAEIAFVRAALLLPGPQPIRIEVSQDTTPALLSLWGNWNALADRGPALLRPLLPGFEEPIVLAFAGPEGYDAGLALWRSRHGGELHLITRAGHMVQSARGLVDAQAWPGDESLVYVPAYVDGHRVRALDVIASQRFRTLRHLAGGPQDLEALWDLRTVAIVQAGPVRAGWSDKETWAGLELSNSGPWWDAHIALGWPYGEATTTLKTPWPWLGASARGSIAALRDGSGDGRWQGDARATGEVWAGPPELRIAGGLTWAIAPTRLDHLRSSLKPVLIRRHVRAQVRLDCGFQAEVLVHVSRLTATWRWRVGFVWEVWGSSAGVHLLGDVVRELARSGVEATVGPLRFRVLAAHEGGRLEGLIGFSWSW